MMKRVKLFGFFVCVFLLASHVNLVGADSFESGGSNMLTGFGFFDFLKFNFLKKLSRSPVFGGAKCELGETRFCSKQKGVCKGSIEMCYPDGFWRGCGVTQYEGLSCLYNEGKEVDCFDRYDNDCDGKTDLKDDDCSSKGLIPQADEELGKLLEEARRKTEEYTKSVEDVTIEVTEDPTTEQEEEEMPPPNEEESDGDDEVDEDNTL